MGVNVKGVFLGIKYAAGQMMKQEPGPTGDRGWIINISSIYGLRAMENSCKLVALSCVYFLLLFLIRLLDSSDTACLFFPCLFPHTCLPPELTISGGYITSKHAVLGLTKASALDCAPHRIHVNALCPGYTATAFISGILGPGVEQSQFRAAAEARHPFKGLGTPQDVARAAVFLASEDAAWVTGVGLPVDGGFSCM